MNIRETLISGGALAPCGSTPDGTKTHNDCLKTGVYIGKKIGRKEGRKRQEVFGKKQLALSSALAKDENKTSFNVGRDIGTYRAEKEAEKQLKRKTEFSKKQQELASKLGEIKGSKDAKEFEEIAKQAKRERVEFYKTGRKAGIEKGKKDAKEFEEIAKQAKRERVEFYKTGRKAGIEKAKKEAMEQTQSKKEFSKKQQELASKLGEVSGKRKEKEKGRLPLEHNDVTINQLKGLLKTFYVPNYQKLDKPTAIQELRNRGINYIKVQGSGITTYKSLKGRGCHCV